ncbi:MAG: alpha/beta hydrolase [Alphaproteobacteria bacterium]|nr:alpha/beta hydrolase [Alphaproteobacteria bacterium]
MTLSVCLALHGAFCGPWVWEEALTTFGLPAVPVELRQTEHPDYHLLGLSDYVDALASAAEPYPGRPVLVGHSMGALVVQKALSRLRPAAIVLLAPVPPLGAAATFPHTMLVDPILGMQAAVAGFIDFDMADPEALSRSLFSDAVPKWRAEEHVRRSQPEPRRALFDCFAPGPIASAAWLGVPTLVIGMDRDPISPPSACRMTALWHGADCRIMPGSGHLMMLEPSWPSVAEEIRRWLKGRGLTAQ